MKKITRTGNPGKKARKKGIVGIFNIITLLNPQNRNVSNNNNISQAPNNQQVLQVENPNDSIINTRGEINMLPEVPAMVQTITSASAGTPLPITAYFLNEADFNATPTNNGAGGAGGGTVTNTYGDGTTLGKGYSSMAKSLAGGNGIKCYGFTLQYTITSSGAQDAAGLNTAAPTWLMANLVGANFIPKGFVLSAGVRNTQYLPGTMTVKAQFQMNALNQFSYRVPVLDTAILTILTSPF